MATKKKWEPRDATSALDTLARTVCPHCRMTKLISDICVFGTSGESLDPEEALAKCEDNPARAITRTAA